jgi:hypothetical protein
VYERRCDLSPDGSLFVYFARKPSGGPDVTADSWIAVSRPPWFTALTLWEIGTTYCAGGFFASSTSVWASGLDAAPDIGRLPGWMGQAPATELAYVDHSADWPDRTAHVNRLLRGGWNPAPSPEDPGARWERQQRGGGPTLISVPSRAADFLTYGGRSVDEYALEVDGELHALGEATWADWDQRGRLVMAQGGSLCELDLTTREARTIASFNEQTPDPQPSPTWATMWPDAPTG